MDGPLGRHRGALIRLLADAGGRTRQDANAATARAKVGSKGRERGGRRRGGQRWQAVKVDRAVCAALSPAVCHCH